MIVRTASKMHAHLDDFSGRLSSGLSKPARRFVSEALYGIAARGSVRLSETGRALEETVALAKTETRLSRNLGRPELRAHLGAAVLREGERIYHDPGIVVRSDQDRPGQGRAVVL